MVSIRRRRLLGLCSGQNSFLAPLSRVLENGHTPENSVENTKPGSVHPLPLNDGYMPKEETISETMNGSPDLSASSPSKEHLLKQFPEVKRRKRHRRKHVENQEPCTMRGVYYKNRKWQAAIKVDKKQIHLGTVGSEEEAARLYDRAAFMCGREPNFELAEKEKQELRKYKWDEFLAITRSAITNKKGQRRTGPGSRRKSQNDEWAGEPGQSTSSASEDGTFAP
ncbi:UNVERIFIED_CONTAM: Ethylene-responsive transcription factor-like protein [Sesamum calycinum]|uniref:Ethylene-responsive transcription factor-like protein n=1 Tax=Sesamum calycinum TaxID=2727403 RepID=A0AAW2SEW6_9LAMI